MPQVTYIEHDGKEHTVDLKVGMTLMEGARNNDINGVIAECGGACACSTCHVYLHPDWVDKVKAKTELEADMLDFALDTHAIQSRLSCQIVMTEDLDGLILKMPKEQT